MITQQPSDKLFALLEFCGLRQRDIVQRLGVSKALVSLWYASKRDVPAGHHAALVTFAEEIFWATLHAWQAEVAHQVLAPEAIAEKRREIAAFVDLVDQARAERDLDLMHFRVAHDIAALADLARTSGAIPWDPATLTDVEEVAQRIVTAIGFLRSHVAVTQTQPAPAVETLAARLTAFVEDVLRSWRPQAREP